MHLLEAAVGSTRHPPGTRVGPRVQRHVQVMVVHSGEMLIRVEGHTAEVPAGSVCLLLPSRREELRFSPDTETRHTWVRGLPSEFTPQLRQRFSSIRQVKPVSSALEYLVRETLASERTQVTAHGNLLDALATAVVWRFVAEAESDPERFPQALELARRHIHFHVEEPMDLDDLAAIGSVTSAHLIRLFRQHLDTTPMRYLWDRRITLGIELLTSTGLPVGVVAKRCGFKTSFHFARRIREATGQTPSQLRAGSWAADE
jgi:AraC family transcriptional regulator of arabinose operon